MKRILTLAGLSLTLLAAPVFGQRGLDSAAERAVKITQGPEIRDNRGTSATLEWETNSAGANHVRYREAGGNRQWQSAYHQGGGTHHVLQLTGLEPGRTYEYQILTRDGDVRKEGQFRAEGHGRDNDRDRDRDKDHDKDRDKH
ncbi:MAG TPA: fibronectin type III domain-containing protein [Candidatus Angelobacter sp.]|nr:fibronectin type III domain-containing protein [Candidatus Angelobacter sp.]